MDRTHRRHPTPTSAQRGRPGHVSGLLARALVLLACAAVWSPSVPKARAAGSVTFDAAQDSGDLSNQTSGSWTHTTSGTNRYLVVGLSGWDNSSSLTNVTVTYNGVALTKLGGAQTAGNNQAVLWGLANPALGSNTVAVNNIPSDFAELGGGSVSFTGAHLTSPTGTLVSETGGDGSVNITLASGDLGVDILYSGIGAQQPAVGANGTERVSQFCCSEKWMMMATEGGAGTVTMSWTDAGGSEFAQAAVPIKVADSEITVSGTVYTDEGATPIGANRTVAVSVNGSAGLTDETDAGGFFSVSVPQTTGAVLTIYLDGETEDAVTATLGGGANLTGAHLYQYRLIVRSDSGGVALANTHLAVADNNGDSDISAIYVMSDGNATLQLKPDKELFVWPGDSFTPGGRVKTHDLDVRGTMAMGTNGLTVSGSLVAVLGTFTTTTGVLLTSLDDTGELLALAPPGFAKDLAIDNGLVGYWKFDDASGGTAKGSARSGKNGSLTQMETGSDWTADKTPVRFFNQSALDFATNDYVQVASPGLPTTDFTWALWVNLDAAQSFQTVMESQGNSATELEMAVNGSRRVEIYSNEMGEIPDITTAGTIPLDTWTHLALRRGGGELSVWFNGVKDANTGTEDTEYDFQTCPLLIGVDADSGCTGSLNGFWDGQMDDVRVYNRALSASEIARLASGYPNTGSGVYNLGSALAVSGSLLNYTAELRTGNAYPITVTGSWLNHGQFTSTGTVYLRGGGNQTMSGNTVFHTLDIRSNGRTRTVFFDHSSRQSASGSLVLRGAKANVLSLRSTRAGSGANLLLDGDSGTQTIDYLNVKDNHADGGKTLECALSFEGCTDSGNNVNWRFQHVQNPANNMGYILFFGP